MVQSRLYILSITFLAVVVFLGACCKAQEDNMKCSDNCFHIKGKIQCLPDDVPLKNIDLRFRATRSTGTGMASCRIIKTKTDKNGEFEFRAELTDFINEENPYSFDLIFKDKKYVNSPTTPGTYERRLAKFYDVDSLNADRYIDTVFYLEKE